MENKQKYNKITMTERTVKIIQYLYESKTPPTVTEIADHMELASSTTFRILTTLQEHNLVAKDEVFNTYSLGLMFIPYGDKVKSSLKIKDFAVKEMEILEKIVGETINLGILNNKEALILHKLSGENSLLVSSLSLTTPLYCSSMGKLFLAHQSHDYIEEYYKTLKPTRMTENTIIDLAGFNMEKPDIIRNNLSYDREEYEYGLFCISSGIFSASGKILAAISISGPTSRLKSKGIEMIEKELLKSTSAINEEFKKFKIEKLEYI